jgi:hypothetical protein
LAENSPRAERSHQLGKDVITSKMLTRSGGRSPIQSVIKNKSRRSVLSPVKGRHGAPLASSYPDPGGVSLRAKRIKSGAALWRRNTNIGREPSPQSAGVGSKPPKSAGRNWLGRRASCHSQPQQLSARGAVDQAFSLTQTPSQVGRMRLSSSQHLREGALSAKRVRCRLAAILASDTRPAT